MPVSLLRDCTLLLFLWNKLVLHDAVTRPPLKSSVSFFSHANTKSLPSPPSVTYTHPPKAKTLIKRYFKCFLNYTWKDIPLMVNRHNKLKLSLIKCHEVIGIFAGHAIIILSLTMTNACPTLCDPRDCSPPGSSVHGTLRARRLEWVAMPSSRGSR